MPAITSEEIRNLRAYKKDYMELIDISHDGKYLVSINGREAYIYMGFRDF